MKEKKTTDKPKKEDSLDLKTPKSEEKHEPSETLTSVNSVAVEEDYKTQMQRVQAEFENYRKRIDSERQGIKDFHTANFLEKIVPILDHFELALKHKCDDKNYALGIEMIFNQLKQILENEGVEEIKILGMKFDPVLAEAISTRFDKTKDENIVLDMQMKGYRFGNKIIRKARVVVNKKQD